MHIFKINPWAQSICKRYVSTWQRNVFKIPKIRKSSQSPSIASFQEKRGKESTQMSSQEPDRIQSGILTKTSWADPSHNHSSRLERRYSGVRGGNSFYHQQSFHFSEQRQEQEWYKEKYAIWAELDKTVQLGMGSGRGKNNQELHQDQGRRSYWIALLKASTSVPLSKILTDFSSQERVCSHAFAHSVFDSS